MTSSAARDAERQPWTVALRMARTSGVSLPRRRSSHVLCDEARIVVVPTAAFKQPKPTEKKQRRDRGRNRKGQVSSKHPKRNDDALQCQNPRHREGRPFVVPASLYVDPLRRM